MVLSSEEERARKQDERAQQLHDLKIRKKEQEEQARIRKMEQEEEFHQARLAALKQPALLEHTSTAKVDEPGESYNLPEGSGTLELDLPGLARRDLYDVWKGSVEMYDQGESKDDIMVD